MPIYCLTVVDDVDLDSNVSCFRKDRYKLHKKKNTRTYGATYRGREAYRGVEIKSLKISKITLNSILSRHSNEEFGCQRRRRSRNYML